MDTLQQQNRFCISASWAEYGKYLEAVGERRIRVTYDRGQLELLSPSPQHERAKKLIAILLESLLTDWDIDYEALGSTTFKREDLDRGLEPDECYWVMDAARVRQLKTFDLAVDPAPELVLEVEISSSVLNRLSLFHALGVSEIWRLTKKGDLIVLGRTEKDYQVLPVSSVISGFPVSDMMAFVNRVDCPRPQLIREFLAWARSFRR